MSRKWSDLRPQPAPARATAEEPIETVMVRLFGTPDGRRLFGFLFEEAIRPCPVNAPESQVREQDGVRRLVEKLRQMSVPVAD